MMNARQWLKHGNDFPYDAGEEFWNSSSTTPPPPRDWAHSAARGVLANLCDRSRVGDCLEQCDEEVKAEITNAIAEIILEARHETNWIPV